MVGHEQTLLSVIGEEVDFVLETISGIQKDDFVENKLLQHAICMALLIIGECISHLSTEFKAKHAKIHWAHVAEIRNLNAHGDWTIDMELVWKATAEGVPQLHEFLAKLG